MTKAITKLKNSLGDGYENKLDETVKSGNIYDVLQECKQCKQLMFYHPKGACTRSDKENALIFDDNSLEELKVDINRDLKNKIKNIGNMDTMIKIYENQQKIFEKIIDDKSGIKRSFQVTNVKQPPVWKKQTFMDYKQQVQNWKQHNSGDDYSKYQDFINELQKNNNIKGLEEYMSTVVIPMTKNDQTVDAVLKYLEEKYEITEWEKFTELISAMNFALDKNVN